MNSSDTTMSSQASFIDIPVAQNVQQILAFDDQSFVYCAYRTLLKRDPDDVGMTYYLGRLRGGENKVQLLKELHSSAEGRRVGATIAGLDAAIRRFKIARMFGIGRAPAVKQQLQSQGVVVDASTAVVASAPVAPAPVATNAVRAIRVPVNNIAQWSEITRDADGKSTRTLWLDLTTSMEWTGGVVGIIRAELEIACGLHKVADNVRFSMQIENGFVEIQKEQLQWLLDAENVADAYMKFFGRYKKTDANGVISADTPSNSISVDVPDTKKLFFPFKANDIVLAVGWMDSKKEFLFPKVKEILPSLCIGYLVYDIIMLHQDTTHFYDVIGSDRFKQYINWVSVNCSFTLFGGETAKNDTEALQREMGWPTPLGAAVKFGTDIMKSVNPDHELKLLKDLGVTGPFIITVGSIEPRKNHDTLYRAYVLALELEPENLPQLIICGKPMWRADDLVDTISRDPRLKGKVLRLSPTDTELAALYKHCSFTVLPSLYEGWSLTLPESLGQGKFCLCTDTPPLREIGKDLVDYAPGWDVKTWAEKLVLYSVDKPRLHAYEAKIASEWPKTRWKDTALMIHNAVVNLAAQVPEIVAVKLKPVEWKKPTIWLDITLTFLYKHEGISGIIRTELNFARYLKSIEPDTRFFAYYDDYFFEVLPEYLIWLFDDSDLVSAYKMFQSYWDQHETAGTGYKNPFRVTQGPVPGHPAYLDRLPSNSIALFVGIDSDQNGEQQRSKNIQGLIPSNEGIMTSQLLYDFTPVLFPQFHAKQTCDGYIPFIKHVSEKFDHILYGGRTAQRDGIKIQMSNAWPTPASNFIEFGSNLEISADKDVNSLSADDGATLIRLGIEKRFIITVGTIEPRKNHEMLYKAYVTMLKLHSTEDMPQMIFVGKKGWKTSDFLATLEADKRVRGKIILLTPSDEELDVLYRHCLFTLLPSFYEGWSLTLPESLSYGKFCLTSDVDPLKETGRDLVEYINPLDTYAWADRIRYYATHPAKLAAKEAYIKQQWKPKTWRESTVMLRDALYAAHKARYNQDAQLGQAAQVAQDAPVKPAGRKAVATAK